MAEIKFLKNATRNYFFKCTIAQGIMTKSVMKELHGGSSAKQLRFIRAQIAALYQIFIANTSDARMINRSLQRKLMRASSGRVVCAAASAPVPTRHDPSVLSTNENIDISNCK